MAYIGVQPTLGNFQACDAITTSATDTFNLLVGGVAISPVSAQHCLVSLNGVFAAALTTDDAIDFITVMGDTLDLGVPSDGTVSEPKLAANTGGIVDWQAVVTGATTMVAGRGYFVNTTSSAFTMTLPASAVRGDEVHIIDYAATADTNNITVGRNSHKIQGASADLTVATERAAFTLVYVDSTQGWLLKEK